MPVLAIGDAKMVDVVGTAHHRNPKVAWEVGTTEPLQQRALTWWSTYQIYRYYRRNSTMKNKMLDEDFSSLLPESWDMFSLDTRLIRGPDNLPAL